jgi:hypothetical protein
LENDIDIEDILMDPSLEEVDDPNTPEDPINVNIFKDKKDYSVVAPKTESLVEKPIVKSDLPSSAEALSTIMDSRYAAIQPQLPASIINDPDDLLEGSLDPGEIVRQTMLDPSKNDALYATIKKDESTSHIFGQVLIEIADEIAYLKAYRKVNFLANEDISETSIKRVRALKSLIETVLEKDKLNNQLGGKIDFHGDRFEKVMGFFLGTVKDAFEKAGIPEQFNDIFFVQLAKDLEGFEKKAEKIYYGKGR